jgi:pimeloyl-ACP methyl ester carboxylesterase
MRPRSVPASASVRVATGIAVGFLELGPADGPLAICLHGFPDTAHTWRHLLPALADAGFRAVAPFLRGYAPTDLAADGSYQTGALAADANALHEALGGTEEAVLVGHDWGAFAAYGAAGAEPGRWRRVVAMAVPPLPAVATGFLSYPQIKRSFYVFFFQQALADTVVAMDDLAFVDRLWRDWSPGYDPADDVAEVRRSLGDPDRLRAALDYYRAMLDPSRHVATYAACQQAADGVPPQPTLYLHGADDGCMGVELADGVQSLLAEGSATRVLDGAGHFLQLERPNEVNRAVLDFLQA